MKIICLFGPSCSGKDTVYKTILEDHPELQQIITYTTRPKRPAEQNGKEYYFITENEFNILFNKNDIIEYRKYDTVHGMWIYCTVNDSQLNKDEIFITINTVEGIKKLKNRFGEDTIIPVYVKIDFFKRICRMVKREWNNKKDFLEMFRRIFVDLYDFYNIPFDYVIINNESYNIAKKHADTIIQIVKINNQNKTSED